MHNTTPITNPEVCVNLWAYLDEQTGLIQRVAGRGYVLTGTEQDKLKALKVLAKSDFLNSSWQPVPQHLNVVTNIGTLGGFTTPAGLNDDYTFNSIFEAVYEQVDQSISNQIIFNGSEYEEFCLKLPKDPLYVLTTVVEYHDGRLEPVL